jgi:hypothetical protein
VGRADGDANQFGWDTGRGGFHVDPAALANGTSKDTSVHVHFVVPSKGRWDSTPRA